MVAQIDERARTGEKAKSIVAGKAVFSFNTLIQLYSHPPSLPLLLLIRIIPSHHDHRHSAAGQD